MRLPRGYSRDTTEGIPRRNTRTVKTNDISILPRHPNSLFRSCLTVRGIRFAAFAKLVLCFTAAMQSPGNTGISRGNAPYTSHAISYTGYDLISHICEVELRLSPTSYKSAAVCRGTIVEIDLIERESTDKF